MNPTTPLLEQLRRRGLSVRTAYRYMRLIRLGEDWCREHGTSLEEAGADVIEAWVATTPRTAATRRQVRCALDHYWRLVVRSDPPLFAIRVPKKPMMVCLALPEDDARILAKAARARGDAAGLVVLLGLYQGLRREEIATLRWESFDAHGPGPQRWLRVVGKGERERTIPLHQAVWDAVAEIPRSSAGYVFPGRTVGSHVSPATVWAWVRTVADAAGVAGVRTHLLRHTALATMNDATGDLRSVQHIAGHARPETTAGYTRASARRLRAAVEAIDYGL